MQDAIESLVTEDEMTMSVIEADQSMRLITPEKDFSQDVACSIVNIYCICTYSSEDTSISKQTYWSKE